MITRAIAALLLALFSLGQAPATAQTIGPEWTVAQEIFINTGPPRQWRGPIYASTCMWDGSACGQLNPAGPWHTVDLTAAPWSLPKDAIAAFLSGVMIITHGNTAETADMHIIFRAPGDSRVACNADNLIGQTVEAHIGGGQRSTMAIWTPVVEGKIEFCWYRSTPGIWPTHSSYAVNLSIQAYAR